MAILPALDSQSQGLFPNSEHCQQGARWFILTQQAILLPITASRTSNLLRTIATRFGVVIGEARYDTFMASVKLPWARLWTVLWRAIPDPLSDGRLLLVLDDSINPKTGTKAFACQTSFDHAATTNQSRFHGHRSECSPTVGSANNSLLKPLCHALGVRAHLLSRLRVNPVFDDLLAAAPGQTGRPRKYGARPASVTAMALT